MNITIHQGANTLGGNCVEIQSGDHSILIDAGVPVTADPLLSKEAFNELAGRASAIFISHPHPDHYEMLAWMEKEIPVYMSRGCKKIIEVAYKFGQTNYNPSSACTFKKETIPIPNSNITVKPIAVDHSGFDSQGYLISDGQQNILYSGDLRDHGRKSYLIEQLVRNIPDTIDSFILEGTLLTRNYKGVQSEEEIEEKLTQVFTESNALSLIAFSSQNIDRLVSVYRACLQTDKTLVIDPYTTYILEELKEISDNLPQYSWNNIGILFAANSYTQAINKEQLFQFAKAKVTKEMIHNNPEKYVLKSNGYVERFINESNLLENTTLIYSQWSGYAHGIWKSERVQHVHCSGHAKIETLEKLIRATNPNELIPIHTEDEDAFDKLEVGHSQNYKTNSS